MSSDNAHRFYKGDNKFLDIFSLLEPLGCIVNIDATELYGGILKHCPLPLPLAMNKFLDNFSLLEPSDYIVNIDATELYGAF